VSTPGGHRSGLPILLRILLTWLLSALGLMLLAWVLPGFSIADFWDAALAAALLGLVNALVWPVLVRFALPLTVLTLGLFPLLLNGVMVLLVVRVVPGTAISGVWSGVVVAIGMALVTMAVTGLLAIDDDDMYFRRLSRRMSRLDAKVETDVPGVVFVQIDGLGHDVFQRAVRNGDVPTLASWISGGTHQLTSWETDWSSQTGASQCGILMGSNEDMPGFRWMEKETGTVLVSNHPKSAAEIEARHSTGKGLLHADGASRGNIFTGDAADAVLTMSVAGKRKGRIGAGYYAYFSQPYNTLRTLLLSAAEVFREVFEAIAQKRRNVRPRVHRGGVFPFLRAFTTVLSRDVTVATLIGDMQAGRSVVYADFLGYDEVAHHCGVERYEALGTLRRLDHELGRLQRAAAMASRPYRIVVLSDHGQSQGATFRDRYGETLNDVVHRLAGLPPPTDAKDSKKKKAVKPAGEESWGYASGAVDEVAAASGVMGRAVSGATRQRRQPDGEVLLGPEASAQDVATGEQAVVLASGSCGLIYLTKDDARMDRERIDDLYPGLLEGLAGHPGIGFVLVRTAGGGGLVLGAKGSRRLDDGTVEGVDPLLGFGPSAPRQVARTHSFAHCGDLMVNSLWDEQTGEVAAFEELVGSHGGLGGEQSHPFILYPSDLPLPAEQVHGAEHVHQLFCGWLGHLGHEAFQEG
jgi:uncharacterized membrane protein YvlD (DUF360 family)